MKKLHATAVMHLSIILIFAIQIAPVPREQTNREHNQGTGNEARLASTATDRVIVSMDEYPNSIDDEFEGCEKDMYMHVKTEQLLIKEMASNEMFRDGCNEAIKYLTLMGQLTEGHEFTREDWRKIALCTYTGDYIYRNLSEKMREGRGHYTTNKFGLISLHFLMTDGIQTRNAEQHPQGTCQTAYRRDSAVINIKSRFVRFGKFASSSLKTTLEHFGNKTCFIITTCYGADISDISQYPEEAEVLIPPYELFIKEPITAVPPGFSDCERVYKLSSVGKESNMKCEYVQVIRANG